MNRKLLVTLCVVALIAAGLIAPSPAAAANLFAINSYEFYGNSERYELFLTEFDTLVSVQKVYCNGLVDDETLIWVVNNFSTGGIETLRSVTSVWVNHGTITHESGACGDGAAGEKSFGPPPNHYKQSTRTDDAGTLSLAAPKNGSVNFAAGTCAVNCTLTPSLPGGAANSLPDDAIATLYMRLGEGGSGSYTVCFAVGDLTNPVIYRYVSGAWVAQAVAISGGQVCAAASGDGAFALGGS